jgi:hypothetical protein
MTPNTTPDYGEPWHNNGFGFISSLNGSNQFFCEAFNESYTSRIISCANACAGMADPAKEIAAMREALNLQGYKLAGFEAEVAGLRAENEAMREAIVAADKAIRMLNHEGMCFCDAQYATNAGSHPRHSDECVQTNVALAKLQPYTTHDTDT